MLRYLFALALASATLLVPLSAQVYTIQPRPMQVDNKPRGGFSLSYRYGAATRVSFEDVGAIDSLREIGDPNANIGRSYDDGFVAPDQRGGGGVVDDGRTNRWGYQFGDQRLENHDIQFHRHRTTTSGASVQADSGAVAGIDMQYDMVFGVFGSKVTDKAWTFTWGGMASGVFSAINANVRGNVTANLLTTTDTYSVEGASVPDAPYGAPSTTTVIGKDADGNDVTLTVDNTVLLNNRPYSRVLDEVTPDGALITGYWQVKGGFYTLRVGPWMRWQFGRRFSLRASVGGSFTFLGAKMEYDEYLAGYANEPNRPLEILGILRAGESSTIDKNERFGYFGALDAEFWLTERTGFFAGVTVEDNGDDLTITAGGRRAVVELPNGTGFRAGISVLF